MSSNDWSYLRRLVKYEFRQSASEGRDPKALAAIERTFEEETGADRARLEAIWEETQRVAFRADFAYQEPNDLDAIRRLRPSGPAIPAVSFDDSRLPDRLLGAWQGRCAACALGKPVECCTAVPDTSPFTGQQRIKAYLQSLGADEYPLKFYIPSREYRKGDPFKLICPESTRQKIAYMQEDDDIRYTIIGQIVLMESGQAFTTDHVARAWVRYLPLQWVCSAEAAAYRNLGWRYAVHCGEWPKIAIDWEWVATYQNPYREWIGAQIRADSWGYAAPGNPELAAEFAWRDARMSHVKNGIYGEMFVAAMIAAAFSIDNPRKIIEAGLAQIPSTSRLYTDIHAVMDICGRYHDDPEQFEPALTEVNALLRHYGTVHTNSNAGIVAAALILGQGDFVKTSTIAVMAGQDTDCNGATVGSIVGAMLGARKLPGEWIEPLHDTIKAQLVGYDPIAITECARRSVDIVKVVQTNSGVAQRLRYLDDNLILE